MTAHSFFTVLRDGQAIHSETADVNLLSTSVDAGPSDIDCIFYYTAPLVPTFWSTIRQDPSKPLSPRVTRPVFSKRPYIGLTSLFFTDPSRYSIVHDIHQRSGTGAESSSAPEQGYLILSVEYRFTYPESPYSSPQLSPVESLSSNSSLPSPSAYSNNVSSVTLSAT